MGLREKAIELGATGYWAFDGDGTDEVGSNDLTEFGSVDFGVTPYGAGSGAFDVQETHENYFESDTVAIPDDSDHSLMALTQYADTGDTMVLVANASSEFSSSGGLALVATGASDKARYQIGSSSLEGEALVDGRWYLLVGTYDAASNVRILYVVDLDGDGLVASVNNTVASAVVSGVAKFRVGGQVKSPDQSTRHWNGVIDEVAAFSGVVLSSADVDALVTALADGVFDEEEPVSATPAAGGDGGPGSYGRGDYAQAAPMLRWGEEKKWRLHRRAQG